ncbi:hypothetical protein L6452_36456 [Arctium lappa]|uniref:Uncharacterized protein n=1 Tax=Arctium lappa TaxID=4217 RepID=A0ACB8YAC9_ARCLA|nr:hypothetical protein L6452_36456 [Arctium lappa]
MGDETKKMKMNAEDGLHRSGGCWMENIVGEDHRRRPVGRRISGFEAIEPTPPDFLGYGRWKGWVRGGGNGNTKINVVL